MRIHLICSDERALEMQVKGETLLITGATSGIGRQMAVRLARYNQVIAAGRSAEKLDDLAAQSANIVPLAFYVSDSKSTPLVKKNLQEIAPKIDRVILNAGDCQYLTPQHIDWTVLDKMMSVNYFGWVNTLKVSMELLEKSPKPHIVGIGSQVIFAPFSKAEGYGASKAAATYFLKSLALDLHHRGIDVSVIHPGFVDTPLTRKNDFPMPFLMDVDEACERILAAIASRDREAIFPKRLYWLLALSKILPGYWFNKMATPHETKQTSTY